MQRILVVDDDRINLMMAKRALEPDYEVTTVPSGQSAMLELEHDIPDMILMDIEMPELDGLDTTRLIKQDARWNQIPIVFLTANSDPKKEIECLKLGADDFITKPFMPMVMKTRVNRLMELYGLRHNLEKELLIKTKQVELVTMNSIMSIAGTIDAKDKYTSGHSLRVAKCSVAIAERLGWTQDEVRNIEYVGLLHDIGKIGVPDAVLNKPARLTDEEFAIIRRHPVIGGEILKEIHTIPHVQEGALYHHERYDGKGYPYGRKGNEIPLCARIVCIADTYDAMSTDRVYRPKLSTEKIIEEFRRCSGTQFDPRLAELFVQMLEEGYHVEVNEPAKAENAVPEQILLGNVLRECIGEAANVSMTDALTGLYNRYYAELHVEEMLHANRDGVMLMLDMDNFKLINDVYGHIIGDRALKTFADALRICAGEEDMVCRLGGDEFMMFVPDIATMDEAEQMAERYLKIISEQMETLNLGRPIASSIGIAFTQPNDDFLSLYSKADKAMYFIKRNGKNSFHIYEKEESVTEENDTQVDLDHISEMIEERMDNSKGTFHVAYGEFQKIYNFILRYVDRSRQEVQLLLLTVTGSESMRVNRTALDAVMNDLERAITGSLRTSDVCTRYSSSQYLVILMDANESNQDLIVDRIRRDFHMNAQNNGYDIRSDIRKLQIK